VLRELVEPEHPTLGIVRQCQLLGLPRSSYYYQPVPETQENLRLMRLIDEQYLKRPFFGTRSMTTWLKRDQKEEVNRKRVRRLMRQMGLEAIYPKPNLSAPGRNHKVYPYLLRNVSVERVDQVWSTDITYIPMERGFMYLAATIDWYSRFVIEVFNTDQGVQFTAAAWTGRLEAAGVKVSMDGKGRCLDNVFVERLWRSLKYEDIYLHCYETVPALRAGLVRYLTFFNEERRHQSLDHRVPGDVYRAGRRRAA
jgi:putative transposase